MAIIDLKDKKIAILLSKDARMSISQIAKSTRLSRDVVGYRIKKLEKEGMINYYKVNIAYRMFGFKEYDVYYYLLSTNKKSLSEFIDRLNNNDYISWISTCYGAYNIRISVFAKDDEHLIKILKKSEKDENIKKEIVAVKKKYKRNPDAFTSLIFPDVNIKIKQKVTRYIAQETPKIDNLDKKLIIELAKNPRASLVDLSLKLTLTAEGISYKLKRLKEKGILLGVHAIIDANKLGFIWGTLNIKLKHDIDIEPFLLSKNYITNSLQLFGHWNLGITIFANSVERLEDYIEEIRNHLADDIEEDMSLIVLKRYKYPAIAEGVLK